MSQHTLKHYDLFGRQAQQIIGQPGYRTRSYLSGYDPLDTQREVAFIQGTLFWLLLTGRLRTRKLWLMAAEGGAGLLLLSPVWATLSLVIFGNPALLSLMVLEDPLWVTALLLTLLKLACFGTALIVSCVHSVSDMARGHTVKPLSSQRPIARRKLMRAQRTGP